MQGKAGAGEGTWRGVPAGAGARGSGGGGVPGKEKGWGRGSGCQQTDPGGHPESGRGTGSLRASGGHPHPRRADCFSPPGILGPSLSTILLLGGFPLPPPPGSDAVAVGQGGRRGVQSVPPPPTHVAPDHRVRPGIELAPSWILVEFISAEPRWELPGSSDGSRSHPPCPFPWLTFCILLL